MILESSGVTRAVGASVSLPLPPLLRLSLSTSNLGDPMTFTERPAARTKVHVEFDGYVGHDSMQRGLQYPWQVCVNDGEFIHYINWQSDIVSKAADPAPEGWPPEVGDVWEDSDGTRYLTRRNTAAPSGPAVLQTIDSDSLRVKESYPAADTYDGRYDEDGTGFILIHRDDE